VKNLFRSPVFIVVLSSIIVYGLHISIYVIPYIDQGRNATGPFSLHELTGDHQLYLVQTQNAAKKGGWFQADPYLAEHSEDQFPQGNLVYLLGALFLWIVDDINFLMFVAPLISIFTGIYFLYRIARNCIEQNGILPFFPSQTGLAGPERKTSEWPVLWSWPVFFIVVIAIYLSSYRTFFYFPDLLKIFLGSSQLPEGNLHAHYNFRFPHIQFTIPLLLFWFYRLQVFFRKPGWKSNLWLGISLGLLQYSYFYFWTGGIVFTAILMCLAFRPDRAWLQSAFSVASTYIALTIPFWIRFFEFNSSAFAGEYKQRLGAHFELYNPTGIPEILVSVFLLGIDGLFLFMHSRNSGGKFSMAGIFRLSLPQLTLTIVILFWLKIQWITGYTIQSYHWLFTFYHPVLAIMLIASLSRILSIAKAVVGIRGMRYAGWAYSVLALLCVASVVLMICYYSNGKAPVVYLSKGEQEVIDYMSENPEPGSVAMSNDFRFMHTVNMLSPGRSYLPYSFMSMAGDAEMLERIVSGYRAIGYSNQEIYTSLKYGNGDFPDSAAANEERYGAKSLLGLFTYTFKDLAIMNFHCPDSLDMAIKTQLADNGKAPYRLDYLIIRKLDYPAAWRRLTNQKVFENEEFFIFGKE